MTTRYIEYGDEGAGDRAPPVVVGPTIDAMGEMHNVGMHGTKGHIKYVASVPACGRGLLLHARHHAARVHPQPRAKSVFFSTTRRTRTSAWPGRILEPDPWQPEPSKRWRFAPGPTFATAASACGDPINASGLLPARAHPGDR